MKAIRYIVWFIMSWVAAFLFSFLDAGFMMLFGNLGDVPFLSTAGYWTLFWLNLAVLQPLGTAAGLAIAGKEFREQTEDLV